jgi:RNA polymerase sigma-70 factor (ECF subfamily)
MPDLEQLYRDHASALLAYLRASFGWCGSANDMLQETFLQALRRKDRLSQADSQRAWLFGIARHVGLTAARMHRPTVSLDEVAPRQTAPRNELDAMREAISGLSPLLRETLELRLRDRLSYEEIAQVMDCPIGTVRSRLHTAMQLLRTALDQTEE